MPLKLKLPLSTPLKTCLLIPLAAGGTCLAAQGTDTAAQRPDIHIVYMGGNDCPPCVVWRREELPKLRQSAAFATARFSYVVKAIRSPVPARAFLPAEVKPLKEQLDRASGGNAGSSQTAIVVNGEVYDYYFGSRSAQDIEKMILAIREGKPYPFERCTRRASRAVCAEPAG